MAKKNYLIEDIDKSKFEFVQAQEKIFDKKFETKPIGYFKDAMIRFTKNKTNLIASIILLILILLSIFLPILSNKNAEVLEERVAFLPPRIPLLEKIGIADGTITRYDQPVDLSTIDPETGIGLPFESQTSHQYIFMDTLENYYAECTEKDELCVGGQNDMLIDLNRNGMVIRSVDWLNFSSVPSINSRIEVDVYSFPQNVEAKLEVQVGPILGEYVTVGTITESGTFVFNPYENGLMVPASAKLQLKFTSSSTTERLSLNSVSVISDSEDPLYNYEASGYKLSQFTLISYTDEETQERFSGALVRSRGERLFASFVVDAYAEAFGERIVPAFSAEEYNRIISANPDVCVQSPDPENPEGWLLGEGCPIIRVIKQNESVFVPGKGERFSYQLALDYQLYMGYEEMPYYWFGTSDSGKDLLKLVFIGLRTSLTIGLIVATINITIGIIYGAISGYYGGQIDIIMERFSEIMGRIPWLVTLSIFIALIGPGIQTLIYVMVVSGWIGVASVTRTQFYRYKGREYVLASRTLGAKDGRLIFRHILPNGIGTIITSSVLMVPSLIFTEATLSYLGFGIGHGQSFSIFGINMSGASIGVLLSDGRSQLKDYPHLTFFPAIIISILMITFNMFGNALRDAFNPALRGSE